MPPQLAYTLPAALTPADLAALFVLIGGWLLIGWLTEHPPQGVPSVSVLMMRYRREWMRHFVSRDTRIFDGNILASLREGTAFFASACMIAIGGGLALIGNTDVLAGLAQEFELSGRPVIWQTKLLLTMLFLVNAFLKFVWSHRLFGYCAIMMGSVPNDPDHSDAMARADQAADLNITAARSFNAGLRSVYFSLASLGWLAGPWVLMTSAIWVLFLTWRREFASNSRRVMLRALPAPRLPDHAGLPPQKSPPPQP